MRVDYGTEAASCTGPLVLGCRQIFTGHSTDLVSVSVFFSTYGNPMFGMISLELKDFLTREVMSVDRCDARELVDNAWKDFKIQARLTVGWRRYELFLRAHDGRPGMSPTAFHAKKTHSGNLLVGTRIVKGAELRCRFEYA